MVRIAESRGKKGESYARLFGNEQLASLLSKVQAAVIRAGFELETMLEQWVPKEMITTLDELGTITDMGSSNKPDVQVVFRPARPDPDRPERSVQADLLVVDNRKRQFHLVEVKEGYVFDTKKSSGEQTSLKSITAWLAQEFPYSANYYFCAFNQQSKNAIVQGAKGRFRPDQVMTGRELCELIGIDYDQLCEARARDQRENLRYFLTQLLEIPEIRSEIIELLASEGGESETNND